MENEKIKKKFEIINALENWRWHQDIEEYAFETSFYNFNETDDKFKEEKTFKKYFQLNNQNHQDINKSLAEKILLTHYLVYICDRQMDYRHIFKAGGYVISHLVEEYFKQRTTGIKWKELLKICRQYQPKEKRYSYFLCAPIDEKVDNKIFEYFLKREKIINDRGKIITKISNGNVISKKTKYQNYDFLFEPAEKTVYAIFSSRYMLQDIGCIYKTLKYLHNECLENENVQLDEKIINRYLYEGSFANLLKNHLRYIYDENKKNKENIENINILARALFELTYQCIPRINAADIKEDEKNTKFDNVINSITTKLVNKLNAKKDFSFVKNRHSLKRMWCIIRDFLINPVFSECFRVIIKDDDKKNDFKKFVNDNKEFIELPGDVWNNNSTFAYCFWNDYIKYYELNDEKKDIDWSSIESSGFVRERYDIAKNNKLEKVWGECKPIDFDITFRFVPRMCEEDNWDICPLYDKDNQNSCKRKLDSINCESNENDWQNKICHEKPKEKICEEKSNEKSEDSKRKDSKLCPLALYSCGIKHKCGNCNL